MINSNMKQFILQQKVKMYEGYGNPKDEWEDTDTIEVSISNQKIVKVVGDQTYLLHKPIGLTKYGKLEKKHEYRLTDDTEEYIIESFVVGRLTQLILKEVIVYE